jgi:uncharacterized protein (DUF885 family)
MISVRKLLEKISTGILSSLSETFPVACASDEFYFFPHIAGYEKTAATWDDFSAISVQRIIREISDVVAELNRINDMNNEKEIREEKNMLVLFLNNLSEQLGELVQWKKQPSFYLTLMNAGLVQALSHEDNNWLRLRVRELPAFLEQAVQNIEEVPYTWQGIGLSMISDCRDFLGSLTSEAGNIEFSLEVLKSLEKKIKSMPSESELYFPEDLLEKIYSNHLATGLKIKEISKILRDETDEMWQVMVTNAKQILKNSLKISHKPAVLIKQVYDKISFQSGFQDPVKIFRNELDHIRRHLMDTGMLEDNLMFQCPVRVKEMPAHFRAIRSASSYSIYPNHPPAEGIFYVLTASGYGIPSENLNEYRMLTAHETYPGHHLLDSSRLGLINIIRRSLEFPLFYEGWACFAEMLLSYTGYFSNPSDRFILAKRRYWRAVRGMVDIGLQMKRLDFESAANILQEAGIPYQRAMASAKIYTLNPGYQICYTVGIRRFLYLYNRYGKDDLKNFVRRVLTKGEILYSDLEEVLKDSVK